VTGGQRIDEQLQPLAEGPHLAAAPVLLAARLRLGAALPGGGDESFEHAAVLLLQLRQPREGGPEAEQCRVAGVDAGDEGVGENLGDLGPGPPPGEGVDRLVAGVAPRPAEALGEQPPLAAPAEHVAAEERTEAVRKPAQLAVEEEVAVALGGLGRGDEPVAEADVAAQDRRGRLAVEEAVRPRLDAEPVVLLRADGAAGALLPFQDGNRGVGDGLLQPVGEGQP
jgi:hypothetical protein